jgi:hypothetical protein
MLLLLLHAGASHAQQGEGGAGLLWVVKDRDRAGTLAGAALLYHMPQPVDPAAHRSKYHGRTQPQSTEPFAEMRRHRGGGGEGLSTPPCQEAKSCATSLFCGLGGRQATRGQVADVQESSLVLALANWRADVCPCWLAPLLGYVLMASALCNQSRMYCCCCCCCCCSRSAV